MTGSFMSQVIVNGIACGQTLHKPAYITFRCLTDQMYVVFHEAKHIEPDIIGIKALSQPLKKSLAVMVIRKYRLLCITSMGNVIDSAGVLNSKFSCHMYTITQL
jgi:hypothetical protein